MVVDLTGAPSRPLAVQQQQTQWLQWEQRQQQQQWRQGEQQQREQQVAPAPAAAPTASWIVEILRKEMSLEEPFGWHLPPPALAAAAATAARDAEYARKCEAAAQAERLSLEIHSRGLRLARQPHTEAERARPSRLQSIVAELRQVGPGAVGDCIARRVGATCMHDAVHAAAVTRSSAMPAPLRGRCRMALLDRPPARPPCACSWSFRWRRQRRVAWPRPMKRRQRRQPSGSGSSSVCPSHGGRRQWRKQRPRLRSRWWK